MTSSEQFEPWQPLIEGRAHPLCRASVIVPARNEELSLSMTLDALASQTNLEGGLLDHRSFEVLLLLNNCVDRSFQTANEWAASHPEIALHVIERRLSGEMAHVGTARRWLMDTAWHRLTDAQPDRSQAVHGILSTDSDSIVRADWVAQNLKALEDGADAVGGVIALKDGELEMLPEGARQAYQNDRVYQSLVAQLEDLIDAQDGDPWPRHLEHFGASLACTPEAYANAGGMPAVQPLEDVAFVKRLRRHGAILRHAPSVVVFTSARFDGRAKVGLSFQLREWQRLSDQNEEQLVDSVHWLIHRFGMMSSLRKCYRSPNSPINPHLPPDVAVKVERARRQSGSLEDFLSQIDCDQIINNSFKLQGQQPIATANDDLRMTISELSKSDAS